MSSGRLHPNADAGCFSIEVGSAPLEERNRIVTLGVREQSDEVLHEDAHASRECPLLIQSTTSEGVVLQPALEFEGHATACDPPPVAGTSVVLRPTAEIKSDRGLLVLPKIGYPSDGVSRPLAGVASGGGR